MGSTPTAIASKIAIADPIGSETEIQGCLTSRRELRETLVSALTLKFRVSTRVVDNAQLISGDVYSFSEMSNEKRCLRVVYDATHKKQSRCYALPSSLRKRY